MLKLLATVILTLIPIGAQAASCEQFAEITYNLVMTHQEAPQAFDMLVSMENYLAGQNNDVDLQIFLELSAIEIKASPIYANKALQILTATEWSADVLEACESNPNRS